MSAFDENPFAVRGGRGGSKFTRKSHLKELVCRCNDEVMSQG